MPVTQSQKRTPELQSVASRTYVYIYIRTQTRLRLSRLAACCPDPSSGLPTNKGFFRRCTLSPDGAHLHPQPPSQPPTYPSHHPIACLEYAWKHQEPRAGPRAWPRPAGFSTLLSTYETRCPKQWTKKLPPPPPTRLPDAWSEFWGSTEFPKLEGREDPRFACVRCARLPQCWPLVPHLPPSRFSLGIKKIDFQACGRLCGR